MPFTKLGISLGILNNSHYRSNVSLRNYTRDNALCLNTAGLRGRGQNITSQLKDDTSTLADSIFNLSIRIDKLDDTIIQLEKRVHALEIAVLERSRQEPRDDISTE